MQRAAPVAERTGGEDFVSGPRQDSSSPAILATFRAADGPAGEDVAWRRDGLLHAPVA